jgi:hypothetical protein
LKGEQDMKKVILAMTLMTLATSSFAQEPWYPYGRIIRPTPQYHGYEWYGPTGRQGWSRWEYPNVREEWRRPEGGYWRGRNYRSYDRRYIEW